MLVGGALLLMADSAECPDGVAEARFDATFTSTCPKDFAPASGTVRILLPATKNEVEQESSLRSDLKAAGIEAQSSSISQSGGSGVCTPASFTFSRDSGETRVRCGSVFLSSATEQTVTCDGSSTKPLALRVGLGTRNFSDASTDGAASDGGSSTGNDGGGGIGDGEDPGNNTPRKPSASSDLPAAGKPISCTITFKKI